MSTLSIRLDDELTELLDREARLAHQKRSEFVRTAIVEAARRREQQRFMEEMVAEMREALADKELQRDSREIAEAFDDTAADGLDAVIEAERAAGIDPDERWWK